MERCGLSTSKPLVTPIASRKTLSKFDGTNLTNPTAYRSTLDALQYYTMTRPDITYIVNKLCQLFGAPIHVHWQAAKRVLRYLSGTASH